MKYPGHNPMDLEPHYCEHISAMTSEGLHSKSDIAIQLALPAGGLGDGASGSADRGRSGAPRA